MSGWILYKEAEGRLITHVGDDQLGRNVLRNHLKSGAIRAQATYLVTEQQGRTQQRYRESIEKIFFNYAAWQHGKNNASSSYSVDERVKCLVHKGTGEEWNIDNDESDEDYEIVVSPKTIVRTDHAYNIRLHNDDLHRIWSDLFSLSIGQTVNSNQPKRKQRTPNARGAGGAPTTYAWAEAAVVVGLYLYDNGIPDGRGPIKEALLDWFNSRYENPPESSTIADFEEKVFEALQVYRESKPS